MMTWKRKGGGGQNPLSMKKALALYKQAKQKKSGSRCNNQLVLLS